MSTYHKNIPKHPKCNMVALTFAFNAIPVSVSGPSSDPGLRSPSSVPLVGGQCISRQEVQVQAKHEDDPLILLDLSCV